MRTATDGGRGVVTLATTATHPGGVWRNMLELGTGLRDRGVDVRFELLPDAHALRASAAAHDLVWDRFGERPAAGVWHLHLGDTYDVRGIRRLLRVRATTSCTVVATEHLPRTNASDLSLPPAQRSPGATALKTSLKVAALRAAHRTVVVSAASAAFLRARYGDHGRIDVVHLGIPDVPIPAPGGGDPRLVLSVGALIRQKGHDTLLEAAARSRVDWRVDVVGDGAGRRRLEAHARCLGLADRVRFLGRRDDVAERLRGAGVVCLPSRWEGFPYAGLEAMAASRAVVATAVDGFPEQIEAGISGLLVPPEDPDALAQALDALTLDPRRADALGAAARSRLAERFSFDAMLDGTLEVYDHAASPSDAWVARTGVIS